MRVFLKLVLTVVFGSFVLGFFGCDETVDPIPDNTETIVLTIDHFFKGEPLELNKIYKGPQNRDLWITKKKYYLSNITATTENGESELIKDVALITVGTNEGSMTIVGKIPKGQYLAISFDLGVREDLNLKDPATYNKDHPLSVFNNMYWSWSTQYIFSKIEGHEILNGDTASFVIHTGTQSLYRPNIKVQRVFDVVAGGSDISINLDVFSILSNSEYTFDLSKDGQSHTVDNLPLAVNYMDNFTVAFD